MKKIRLIPIAGLAAIAGVAPVLATSCSHNNTITEVLEIDTSNRLLGFKSNLTQEQISDFCKGTLTIPSTVKSIAPYAFFDWATQKSTIPSSITNLVFEENIDIVKDTTASSGGKVVGYSALHNDEGAEAAIGDCAFKNAPFNYIKLPVGLRYDIGVSAFEGSKIVTLTLPHPRFNDKPDFTDKTKFVGAEVAGYWRGYLTEIGNNNGNIATYRAAHLVNIRDKAFYNCKSLKHVTMSSLVSMKDQFGNKSEKIFRLYNETSSEETPSNIKYLDFSDLAYMSLYTGSSEYVYDKEITAQVVKKCWEDVRDNSGGFKINDDAWANQLDCEGDQTPFANKTDLIYVVMNKNYIDGTVDEINKFNTLLNFAPFANLNWPNMMTQFGRLAYIPSDNNLSKDPTTNPARIDYFDTTKQNITVSLAAARLARAQQIALQTESSLVPTYGLRGDIKFEITAGQNSEAPISLEHIKIDELDKAARPDYLNDKYTITWEEGKAPKVGSTYDITFNAYCVDTQRYTPSMKLSIKFTA